MILIVQVKMKMNRKEKEEKKNGENCQMMLNPSNIYPSDCW